MRGAVDTGCITGIFRPIIAGSIPYSTDFEFLVLSSLRDLLQPGMVSKDVYFKW